MKDSRCPGLSLTLGRREVPDEAIGSILELAIDAKYELFFCIEGSHVSRRFTCLRHEETREGLCVVVVFDDFSDERKLSSVTLGMEAGENGAWQHFLFVLPV